MSFVVAPIVEGHGDVAAVPVLLRRMAPSLLVARPVRFPRSQLVVEAHLCRAAAIANANIGERGAILLVMDADEDCAASLGPELEARLADKFPGRTCRVVLVVREFEAWIVGGDPKYQVDDADSAGDMKGRIREALGLYKETADQPRLIAKSDIDRLTRVSRSFRRLRKVVDGLIAESDRE